MPGPKPCLHVYTDCSLTPDRRAAGLAAVVRDPDGVILHAWKWCEPGCTCNEGEYLAVIYALQNLEARPQREDLFGRRRRPEIRLYSDSQVLVSQMQGWASVHSPGLRQVQARLRSILIRFPNVTFVHIPRDQNRLADVLAAEALVDWKLAHPEIRSPGTKKNGRGI